MKKEGLAPKEQIGLLCVFFFSFSFIAWDTRNGIISTVQDRERGIANDFLVPVWGQCKTAWYE
jgi:hypothetical protein